jgi:hypothetical protein
VNKKQNPISQLSNPNDDSHGQCCAPIENGKVILEKKQHFEDGKEKPNGWKEVPCGIDCHSRSPTGGVEN